MARGYYFDYISKPGAFKNSIVEIRAAGEAFAFCVCDVLREYGVQICEGPRMHQLSSNTAFRAFIPYYRDGGLLTTTDRAVDIEATADSLRVDFKFDPLIFENTNDELIADIRSKAIDKQLIEEGSQTHINENLKAEKESRGGCYIATAVYGSYDCPEVWTLRRFRDNKLAKNRYGRIFIRFYYTVSPILVRLFGQTKWFKQLWKRKLDIMVHRLQKQGYESEPYQDYEPK